VPNYEGATEFPSILVSDIDRSHSIAVILKATGATAKGTPLHRTLAPMSTTRTRLTGIAFLLEHYLHAMPLSLVGEHVARASVRPLMELLIVRGANIQILTNVSHVSNDERLHTCLMQCGYEFACLFVLNIPHLLFDFLELFLLGAD
jgi:hypothetical protein